MSAVTEAEKPSVAQSTCGTDAPPVSAAGEGASVGKGKAPLSLFQRIALQRATRGASQRAAEHTACHPLHPGSSHSEETGKEAEPSCGASEELREGRDGSERGSVCSQAGAEVAGSNLEEHGAADLGTSWEDTFETVVLHVCDVSPMDALTSKTRLPDAVVFPTASS